jgi:hypothetical protein
MLFQRLDTGEMVSVHKPVVITFGEANIEINGEFVRCRKISNSDPSGAMAPPPPVFSEIGLCFPQHELEKKREHVERHGFTGVEFRRDPRVPESFNVHFSGPEERKRYEKSLGVENFSGFNGGRAGISGPMLDQASDRIKKLFGASS